MIWLPMAIGAGAGLLKNQMEQGQANDERRRQAEVTRYSPWTGMHGQSVKNPSLFGNVATGAASGAMLGQQAGADASAAGPAVAAAPAAGPSGSGAAQFSLNGPATNAAPYQLGQSPQAAQAMGSASKFGLMPGSAGSLNPTQGAMSPWDLMSGTNSPDQMAELYKNMYAQNK